MDKFPSLKLKGIVVTIRPHGRDNLCWFEHQLLDPKDIHGGGMPRPVQKDFIFASDTDWTWAAVRFMSEGLRRLRSALIRRLNSDKHPRTAEHLKCRGLTRTHVSTVISTNMTARGNLRQNM